MRNFVRRLEKVSPRIGFSEMTVVEKPIKNRSLDQLLEMTRKITMQFIEQEIKDSANLACFCPTMCIPHVSEVSEIDPLILTIGHFIDHKNGRHVVALHIEYAETLSPILTVKETFIWH